MKRKQSIWQEDKPVFVILAIVVLCCWWAYNSAYGDGFPFTFDRAEGFVSFQHSTDCDSARVYFGYSDSTNFYVNIKLSPEPLDSSYLFATTLDLDSLGTHQVRTWYWEAGSADSTQEPSFWFHSNYGDLFAVGTPGAANLCRVYGYVVDVGAAGWRNVTVTATLAKDTYDSCSNTVVFKRSLQTRTTGDSGYFALDLTYSSCLSDEKYEFTFHKKDHMDIVKSLAVPDSTTHYIQWDD